MTLVRQLPLPYTKITGRLFRFAGSLSRRSSSWRLGVADVAMFFTTHVNITALAQDEQCQTGE
jgi:hypothetical protein